LKAVWSSGEDSLSSSGERFDTKSSNNSNLSKKCANTECDKVATHPSKYCSKECGINVARRLLAENSKSSANKNKKDIKINEDNDKGKENRDMQQLISPQYCPANQMQQPIQIQQSFDSKDEGDIMKYFSCGGNVESGVSSELSEADKSDLQILESLLKDKNVIKEKIEDLDLKKIQLQQAIAFAADVVIDESKQQEKGDETLQEPKKNNRTGKKK